MAPLPAVEPISRSARVEAACIRHVLFPIREHVHQAVPHFARRRNRPHMVTIAPNTPSPSENAVDRTCYANRKAARTARKSAPVIRFDEKMEMIHLHREMHDAKCL